MATTTTTYIARLQPPGGTITDQGTSVSLPVLPIGSGWIVGSSTDASATFEVRITSTQPAAGVTYNGLGWTLDQVLKALEDLKRFLRQRGYIAGSGGPSGAGEFNV